MTLFITFRTPDDQLWVERFDLTSRRSAGGVLAQWQRDRVEGGCTEFRCFESWANFLAWYGVA